MKPVIFKIKILFFVFFFSCFSVAKILTLAEYPYPIQSSELATIASAAPYDMKLSIKKVQIELFPERAKVYLLEDRHIIDVNYLMQDHKAPLVFIIPGVGGTGTGPVIQILMEQAYELGYHVIALPNPLSWVFTLGASKRGVPGYLPWDVLDLYSLMEQIILALNLKVSEYSVMGYSLGAGLLPELSDLDAKRKVFSFKKLVLLNPPVNFDHGVKTLDDYFQLADSWTKEEKDSIMGYLYSFAERIINNKNQSLPELLKLFQLSKRQQRYIIGNTYRESLGDIIYTMELLLNHKFLTSEVSWGQRSLRVEESRKFSFAQYLDKIVLKAVQKEVDKNLRLNEIVEGYNLKNSSYRFATDKRFYLMHNANDFLLEKGDVDFFEHSFSNRAIIFPLGGHCGNYSFPINKIYLKSILAF